MTEITELTRSAIVQAAHLTLEWRATAKIAKLSHHAALRCSLTRKERLLVARSLQSARRAASDLSRNLRELRNRVLKYLPDLGSSLNVLGPSLRLRWRDDDSFIRQLTAELSFIEQSAAWRAFGAGGPPPELPQTGKGDNPLRSIKTYHALTSDEREFIVSLSKVERAKIVKTIAHNLEWAPQKVRRMAIEFSDGVVNPLVHWPRTSTGKRKRGGMTLTKFGEEIASQIQNVNNAKIK
jgi:hypothetical protein